MALRAACLRCFAEAFEAHPFAAPRRFSFKGSFAVTMAARLLVAFLAALDNLYDIDSASFLIVVLGGQCSSYGPRYHQLLVVTRIVPAVRKLRTGTPSAKSPPASSTAYAQGHKPSPAASGLVDGKGTPC